MVQLLEKRELILEQLRHQLTVRVALNPVLLIDLDGALNVCFQVQSFVHFSEGATAEHPGPPIVLPNVVNSVHTAGVPEVDRLELR